MLHGADGDSRTATHATLSQLAGSADGADENQDQHPADGSGNQLQQAEAPQGRLFARTIGHQPGHRRKSALPASSVPGDGGAPKQNGKCSDPFPAARSITGRTCGAPDEYSSDRADHGADLGLGNRRATAILVDQEGHQLLRVMRRGEEFGANRTAHAAVQTAQQAFTDDVDRGGQDGPALQPDTGIALRPGNATRQRQPRNPGRRTEVGGLSDGGGSRPDPFSPQKLASKLLALRRL